MNSHSSRRQDEKQTELKRLRVTAKIRPFWKVAWFQPRYFAEF